MIPVGETRDDHAFEVRHDAVERLRIVGRGRRQRGGHIAGRDLRQDRIFFRVLEVLGNPVDELVAVLPERGRVHVQCLCE